MKFTLAFLLASFSFTSLALSPDGKIVIDVQSLVSSNHSGLKSLTKFANERGAILSWSYYKAGNLDLLVQGGSINMREAKIIQNPDKQAYEKDFVISQSKEREKRGWKNYNVKRYILRDAVTLEVLKTSEILDEDFKGGCKPGKECVLVGGGSRPIGLSETKELKTLIDFALTVK